VYDLAPTGGRGARTSVPRPHAGSRADEVQPLAGRRTAARLALGGVAIAAIIVSLGLLLTRILDHSGLVRADLRAERWFAAHRSSGLDHITLIATWLAETPVAIAVAVLAFIGLRIWLHRWRESWVVATAVIGELLVFLATTSLVDRARPPVHRLDGAPPTSSFPSGHTGAAVAIYGSLAILLMWRSARPGLSWPLAVFLALLPIAVGAARLYRGMHYPTDVVAGALNGALWVLLAFTTLLPRRAEPHRAAR
jgi:membrane-associated phospholipid phosphatase